MAERTYFCGIDPPRRMPKNSKVLQNFGDQANVKIEPLAISAALVAQVPDRLLDLLDIASYVFAADQLTTRGGPSGQRMGSDWYRTMHFRIAVRDLAHWQSPELVQTLKDLLGFMSGDEFSFEFEKSERSAEPQGYLKFGNDKLDGRPTTPMILFSGGLDSLAGALEELSGTQDRVVLITHRSSQTMTGCQNNLAEKLRQHFPGRVLYIPFRMTLTGGPKNADSSQRTRTFLFSAIAGSVACLLRAPGIRFYENGIMSLNLPISQQVVGTAATRSTHPRTLSEMSVFLEQALGRPCIVDNPFVRKTKAEVLKLINDGGHVDLIKSTISCTRVRRRVKGKTHCGVCVQCLHRRFATLAAGLSAHDPAEDYSIDLFTSERDVGHDRTMVIEFVRSARDFVQSTAESFVSRFAGELSRLQGYWEDAAEEDHLHAIFDLHRRHGRQVTDVIKDGIAKHKVELSRGTLPPGCLLSCVVGTQGEPIAGYKIDQEAPTPQTSINASDIELAIDEERNEFRIRGLPPIGSPSGIAILLLLAEQHEADTANKRAHENFSFVASARLEKQLGISNDALRRRIERLRDKIAAAFRGYVGRKADPQLIIESSQWQGYRLNPRIRLVALGELKKPDRHNSH